MYVHTYNGVLFTRVLTCSLGGTVRRWRQHPGPRHRDPRRRGRPRSGRRERQQDHRTRRLQAGMLRHRRHQLTATGVISAIGTGSSASVTSAATSPPASAALIEAWPDGGGGCLVWLIGPQILDKVYVCLCVIMCKCAKWRPQLATSPLGAL